MKKRIYVADDDPNILEILKIFLDNAGFDCKTFETGDELLREFITHPADMAILDLMMPGTDGIEICRQIRAFSSVPIIILTAKDSEMDYTQGITSGGDDYLIKPFKPSLLVMRVKAMFRRIEMEQGKQRDREIISFGDVTWSEEKHCVECGGRDVGFTEKELEVFRYMLIHQDEAVSRATLLDEVWGYHSEVETRVTDETVRRIKKKLLAAGSSVTIKAVWGYGYRLHAKQ